MSKEQVQGYLTFGLVYGDIRFRELLPCEIVKGRNMSCDAIANYFVSFEYEITH